MARLTDLQTALLEYVSNAAEPTWLMLNEVPEAGGDRSVVEDALRDLEGLGLVRSTREPSGRTNDLRDLDSWWALTDAGWSELGLSKPPHYR